VTRFGTGLVVTLSVILVLGAFVAYYEIDQRLREWRIRRRRQARKGYVR
jgi:hypothetical protein